MSPRVAGAALALLAAITLLVSVAGIPAGWWAGHPVRNGEAMHKKDVNVSLLSAVGCNTGGDSTCQPLEMSGAFDAVRYVELGASGLLVLALLVLAGMIVATSERRKGFAKVAIALALICGAIAGALIVMPKMATTNIGLPIGPGLFVFFGGLACAILGAVFAMRPTPKLELQPPRQSFAPALGAPPAAQPVDVLAMLQPEPVQPNRPPPSPGGKLAGPAGPLGPPSFGAAPIPTPVPHTAPEPPPLPPPTPFPAQPSPFGPPPPDARARSASAAPPMPSIPAARSRNASQMPALSASGNVPAIPGDRSKSSSQMPAIPGDRSKSSSQVPAIPPDRSKGSGNVPAIPGDRSKSPSTAPALPGVDRSKLPSIAPPSAEARTKAASIAPIPSTVAGMMPPVRAKGATGLPPPRAKGPSVPPPGAPKPTTVAAVVPPPLAGPIIPTRLPMRADTDPSDALETMDRDAMTIARDGAPAVSLGRPATDASIGDNTDASVALPEASHGDERTDLGAEPIEPPIEPRDSASDIQTSAQRKLTQSELVRTVARESQSEIETIAREKISARDLHIGDSTNPAIIPRAGRTSAKEIAELGEAPTARATTAVPPGPATTPAPTKIPMSTASESLPPPKKEAVPVSGPTPACPQCEAPMAWVEEHLRFYCKSCRMYF